MITDNQSIDLSDFVNENILTFRAKLQLIYGCRSLSNSPRKMSIKNEQKKISAPFQNFLGMTEQFLGV